jgi:hypothetical protein
VTRASRSNNALLLAGPVRKRLARYARRPDCDDAPQQNANPLDDSEAPLNDPVLTSGEITAQWAQWHPDVQPLGFLLRDAYPDRWLRIHSLSEGKRYATSGLEHAEIRRRHLAVAEDVISGDTSPVVLVTDTLKGETAIQLARHLGFSESAFPRLWQLPAGLSDAETGVFEEPMAVFGSQRSLDQPQFDRFVSEVAEDRCRGLLFAPTSGQIYAPYDGGADLIYPSEPLRDAAADRYSAWVSPREDGL